MPPTAAEYAARQEIPVAQVQSRAPRPTIVGPDTLEQPFPIYLVGPVQKGFGRGGKDLGCPTANLPDDSITPISSVAKTGVYYGYAQVLPPQDHLSDFHNADLKVLPMVMSLGWNPFYKNKVLTAEIHIMHNFKSDFYGYEMRAVVLGYIRPELDYISREALIEDIEIDKQVALNCLQRPAYQIYANDSHFQIPESEFKASM
ncbi:Riboflavin kinase [Psilocybe cubensis]|uniref:Riboflavin kinase n=2 Tax=Psilocybe cubensis TaxID=181762 RepID=A0A8H8CKV1_PSICU|nr:Riboflavin kinase [Psilocybe cubensis]KAH9482601.1 Riboflavin kinase [Psilocybe cubensis]